MKQASIAVCAAALILAPTVTVAGARSSSSLSGLDEQFLKSSIQGDRFEIAGGKLAERLSSNATVRALGVRLVKDHTQSLDEAIKLARKLRVGVPKTPTPSQQWELRVVGQFSGTPFDRWYSDLEVLDHQQDISEATDETKHGSNSDVRAGAKKELPILRRHLALSRQALKAS